MSICQLGMHKSVQDHTNANVCKQTYDASCPVISIWQTDGTERNCSPGPGLPLPPQKVPRLRERDLSYSDDSAGPVSIHQSCCFGALTVWDV